MFLSVIYPAKWFYGSMQFLLRDFAIEKSLTSIIFRSL